MDLKIARTGLAQHFAQAVDNAMPDTAPSHPYYPLDLKLPGYVPLTLPFSQILAFFFGSAFLIFAATWYLSRGRRSGLDTWSRLALCWFVVSGTIHFVVEGTYVLNSRYYTNTTRNVLLEIWKEYTKADSRYATRDAFVVSMEGITAFFVGPACYLTAWAIACKSPWRHTLQIISSVCQMYGDACYFLTAYLEGMKSSRPEFLYFWFYFVIVNAVWLVIPSIITACAGRHICSSVAETDRLDLVAGPRDRRLHPRTNGKKVT